MTPPFDRRAIPSDASESQWHAAGGQAIRRIDWTHPAGTARGSLLFMPGRGDFYEKYLETLDHWHRQGWNVTAADWRGQGGSGRLGRDQATGHIDDFSTWVADLADFWREWSGQRPGPHVLAGHSMGGHLVLRAVAEGRVDPAGLILSAPMLGFHDRLPAAVMHIGARIIAALGDSRRRAWTWSEKPGEVPDDRINLLTHDVDRYADELWWRDERPFLNMGPGSWGWVERAYASMRALARSDALNAVRMPVLIIATDHDKLVAWPAIDRAASRLADCRLVRFGAEAEHEILREDDAVRDRAIAATDDFLGALAAG